MAVGEEEDRRPRSRPSLKTRISFNNYQSWKDKLRENCFKRVREDRTRLLWRLRLSDTKDQSLLYQDIVKSTFQDIVSNELRRIKNSSLDENSGNLTPHQSNDDDIWEYDGLHAVYQGDCEEMLLEMQKIFYEDLTEEEFRNESNVSNRTWDDEEDEYLAHAVYEHMQLNGEQVKNVVWCPVCKQGELQQKCHLICCTLCQLKLDRDDEINLELLRNRLAEAHTEHLDRGCRLKPEFSTESRFQLTALYIKCQGCNMFEIVI